MKTYSISYSINACGGILINAPSESIAIEIFDSLDIDLLFQKKDLYRGIEIEEIGEI